MIRMLLLLTAASIGSLFAYGDFAFETVLFAGMSPGMEDSHALWDGSSKLSEVDTLAGFSLAVESTLQMADNVAFGLGMSYLLPRELDVDGSEPAFEFTPVYAIVSFHGNRYSASGYPYLNLHLGTSLGYHGNPDYTGGDDLSGGLYMGGSLGFAGQSGWRLEARYGVYEGELDTLDIKHREYGLLIGHSF